jgi:hypothetical protein
MACRGVDVYMDGTFPMYMIFIQPSYSSSTIISSSDRTSSTYQSPTTSTLAPLPYTNHAILHTLRYHNLIYQPTTPNPHTTHHQHAIKRLDNTSSLPRPTTKPTSPATTLMSHNAQRTLLRQQRHRHLLLLLLLLLLLSLLSRCHSLAPTEENQNTQTLCTITTPTTK